MKVTSTLAILFLVSASAIADDSSCERSAGKIAIRLLPEDSLAGQADLPLKLRGKPLSSPATASMDPDLGDVWIFTSTALMALADHTTLVPSVPCLEFKEHRTPFVGRLPDGECYLQFAFRVASTCWSLRVKSSPYGYPFRVHLGKKSKPPRLESARDPDWNLERDLPLGTATVEIFDRQQSNLRLLSIRDVTYVRLKSDPEAWKLDRSKLEEYSSTEDNQIHVGDDAARLVRQRLIRQMEYIHLLLEGAKEP